MWRWILILNVMQNDQSWILSAYIFKVSIYKSTGRRNNCKIANLDSENEVFYHEIYLALTASCR